MAETGALLKAGNWYGNVGQRVQVTGLRGRPMARLGLKFGGYSTIFGDFANFVGYSKIFEVFSKFLVDNIFSQCFWSPQLRKGDM